VRRKGGVLHDAGERRRTLWDRVAAGALGKEPEALLGRTPTSSAAARTATACARSVSASCCDMSTMRLSPVFGVSTRDIVGEGARDGDLAIQEIEIPRRRGGRSGGPGLRPVGARCAPT